MFSLPTSLPSPSAFGRIFSLDSWLAHLKSWHHSDRRPTSRGAPNQGPRIPRDAACITVLPSISGPLSLNLPSPTMHLSFELDPGLSFETDSEASSAATSRCSTPNLEHDYNLKSTIRSSEGASTYPAPNKTATTSPPVVISPGTHSVPQLGREALLSQYSHQELVLLEFLTHTSGVATGDIDEILCMYPPGFTNACHCASQDEEAQMSKELCGACQLADAYIEYSFERSVGAVEVTV